MKKYINRIYLVMIAVLMLACSLPTSSQSTPTINPPPNVTIEPTPIPKGPNKPARRQPTNSPSAEKPTTSSASAQPTTPENSPNTNPSHENGTYVTITVPEGTITRSASLYLPAKYSNNSTKVPLILSFHGFGGSGSGHGALTGLDTLADTQGLLVAYPNGLPIDPNNLKKGLKWDAAPGSADVKFIRDLVSNIEKLHYRVDSSRIYATGMSNGGGMTHRVGCELADIVAAIAPVEGGYGEPGWTVCNPARPVPVISFHGTPDPVVPYYGGKGKGPAAGNMFPPIPEWAAAWAKRDSCNKAPTMTQFNSHISKTVYSQCHGNASVILYSIDDNGHAWPGSSMPNASQAIDATTEIWNFFLNYTLPSP